MQFIHQRRAVLLMKQQPAFRRQLPRPCLRVGQVDLAQSFQHIATLFREVRGNLDYLPSSMSQTVGKQDFHARQFGRVPRKSVAHLNGRIQLCRAPLQHIGEILARNLDQQLITCLEADQTRTRVLNVEDDIE